MTGPREGLVTEGTRSTLHPAEVQKAPESVPFTCWPSPRNAGPACPSTHLDLGTEGGVHPAGASASMRHQG